MGPEVDAINDDDDFKSADDRKRPRKRPRRVPLAAVHKPNSSSLATPAATTSVAACTGSTMVQQTMRGFTAPLPPGGQSLLAAEERVVARVSSAPRAPPGLAPPPERAIAMVFTQLDAAPGRRSAGVASQVVLPSPSPPLATYSSTPAEADDAGDEEMHLEIAGGDHDSPLEPGVVVTFIAGRHAHKSAPGADAGAVVSLEREPDNAVDSAALKVVIRGECLGYVPATVASHLSPLIDAKLLALHATLPNGSLTGAAVPSGDAPVLHITASVTECSKDSDARTRRTGWTAAAAAAAATLPGGAACAASALRNMRALVTSVLHAAPYLFTEEQTSPLCAFITRDEDTSSLSDSACSLLVHMLLRNGPWFKLASLRYADVEDSAAAAEELQTAGLAHMLDAGDAKTCSAELLRFCASSQPSSADNAKGLCKLLSAAQARAAVREGRLASATTAGRMSAVDATNALAAGLCSPEAANKCATAWTKAFASSGSTAVIRLTPATASAFERAQRLFFLGCGDGGSMDVSRFLLVDLGVVKYPRITGVSQQACSWTHLFPTREHLEAFETASECELSIETALQARDDAAAMAACMTSLRALGWHDDDTTTTGGEALAIPSIDVPFLACFTAVHVHIGCAAACVGLYERARNYSAAIALLHRLLASPHQPQCRGKWWYRLATDLEHVKLYDDALDACEAGHSDAWTRPAQALALRAKAVRLAKPPRRWKVPAWATSGDVDEIAPRVVRVPAPPALRSERSKKSLFAAAVNDDDPSAAENHLTVEQLALAHYTAAGWPCGVHTESQVWCTLFGLLFWDILFDATSAPAGAFLGCPFQMAPLDLHSPHFAAFPPRAQALSTRLKDIAAGNAPRRLAATWAANRGTLCCGVSWTQFTLQQLQDIAMCVGGGRLAAIMRLLALDYRGWRGGMPDLLLWRPATREALLVEVKGVNDALRSNQLAWAQELARAGLNVEILQYH